MRDDQPGRRQCTECRDLYTCDNSTRAERIQHGYKHFSVKTDERCLSCGLRKTVLCSNPGRCISNNFSMYRQAKPWSTCKNCGAKLRTPRTKQMSDTVIVTFLECPECGLKAELMQEYIDKGWKK